MTPLEHEGSDEHYPFPSDLRTCRDCGGDLASNEEISSGICDECWSLSQEEQQYDEVDYAHPKMDFNLDEAEEE